ncbi:MULTISPECIES: WecB/TagA/CpsF family glycosyltransferase [Thalassospira]|uniref:WecB/TagA/CpsF family glycosyltransferase n=1 Tax=Thalassospira aquimaris TaxID=3037796 RepID=A0ABT6GE68_9PROT|nr:MULTISPECIES: WecB/TagA/CpsF family glycosyltransferase [Thalassospira]MDG4720122.1 WecB/TagA/CpsF family glycosyltransferase [Thalassospira sp. FZY0004]
MSANSHNSIPRMQILGISVSVVNMAHAVTTFIEWARTGKARKVFVRDVASLMLAVKEPRLQALHENADMVTPDGMPLAWIGKLRGYGRKIGRVSGADIVDAVCAASLKTGQTHYFYGGQEGVAERMAANLAHKYPGLKVAGTFSPPWREIGPASELTDEIRNELDAIRASGADFVWIGLSSPKQDYFISKAAPYSGRGVFFAVGAAFDFHSGNVKRAPVWMQKLGLECIHRLFSDPKRLWRRYILLAPKFIWLIALENLDQGKASRNKLPQIRSRRPKSRTR